ncbi:MAG: tetratricopeptide repeat protein [Opitutaceae bacterium]|nr:tetratricopeptide repeat protein [Opitutaceae bacterium]
MNKTLSVLAVFATACSVAPASVLPLTEVSWNNPTFVAAFTGSYGFDTEKTPSITSEEKKVFEQLAPLMASSPDQAITLLQTTIKPESSAALDYTLANLFFQSGKTAEATAAYHAALKKFPGFARAQKNLGILLVQSGRFQDALPWLLQSAESGGLDGATLGLIGFTYLSLGKTASALDAYRLALIFEPDSRDWKIGKAQCLINIGENKEAIAILDELIPTQAKRADLLMLQANAYLADNDAMRAAANLQIVRSIGAATSSSLILLGDIFVNAGSPDLALPYYLEAIASPDLDKERIVRAARVLASREAWTQTDTLLERIAAAPGALPPALHNEVLNLQAQVALGLNDDARAAKILESVVAADPLNGRALILLADYYWKQRDVERADLNYSRAASVESVAPDALIQHARMLVTLRDYPRAVALLNKAQVLRPQANVATYLAKVEAAAQAAR